MSKTDPRPFIFVFVGSLNVTVDSLAGRSGGRQHRRRRHPRVRQRLLGTDVLHAADVLTITPNVAGGTTNLIAQQNGVEFSGNWEDLDGVPPLGSFKLLGIVQEGQDFPLNPRAATPTLPRLTRTSTSGTRPPASGKASGQSVAPRATPGRKVSLDRRARRATRVRPATAPQPPSTVC